MEAVSYCPLVQVTFHSSALIFICPDPMLNYFCLISALLCTFYKNTESKFLKFTYHLGHLLMAVVPIDWLYIGLHLIIRRTLMCIKLMCLNINFCLYHSSVMDLKSCISSSIFGILSIFKHPNKILNSISKALLNTLLNFTRHYSVTKLSMFYCLV